jgi:hypothetical protein
MISFHKGNISKYFLRLDVFGCDRAEPNTVGIRDVQGFHILNCWIGIMRDGDIPDE